MFLAIDIGNSNIVFGLYDQENRKWKAELRVETRPGLLVSSLQEKVHLYFLEKDYHVSDIEEIGVSSVVPELNVTIIEFCKSFLGREPYIIAGKSYDNLKVSVARPDEIGTDLMANVTAAYVKYNQATIIVDFGTALTFTIVSASGEVMGVNIVPGIKTAIKSLFNNTAKLPEVDLEWPESVIGKGTVHSIQAGILHGYTGLVKGMLADIQNELADMDFKIVATGGLSSILVKLESEFDEVDRNLTLEGIRLITMGNK
ncbi:type III pantothenate kinase [Litoribacter alkaliphilus]|uniref:Type III pantothenate kinase n=1 Tax=Litoribacter ruber TaxID=702568 RepID=A0AAP2CGU0_9BACT|nr:type III pantothenate kinase [Litoribacter alkaliphilus]MBS9523319.1 type III pantothenate kinase [Litoribacter alkaliphilus]